MGSEIPVFLDYPEIQISPDFPDFLESPVLLVVQFDSAPEILDYLDYLALQLILDYLDFLELLGDQLNLEILDDLDYLEHPDDP